MSRKIVSTPTLASMLTITMLLSMFFLFTTLGIEESTSEITPKSLPQAVLWADPTDVEVGEPVTFNGSLSYDPDGGSIVEYWFDFGDGFNSGWNPLSTYVWEYTDPGVYNATLKVKDDEGEISDWSPPRVITVGSGSIEVTVVDYYGTPLVPETLILYYQDWRERARSSPSSNVYTFNGLPSGIYHVEAYVDDMWVDSEENINVTAGQTIHVELQPGWPKRPLTVTVYYSDGSTPLGGAAVEVWSWDGYHGSWNLRDNKTTDDNGQTSFLLWPTSFYPNEKYLARVMYLGDEVGRNETVPVDPFIGGTVEITTTVEDLIPPTIGPPNHTPDPPDSYESVTVVVDVWDEESGVQNVIISWSIDDKHTWEDRTMDHFGGSVYTYEIPGYPAGTYVYYKIIAYDNYDNEAVDNNAGEYYYYPVIPEFQGIMILVALVGTSIVIVLLKKSALRKTNPLLAQ